MERLRNLNKKSAIIIGIGILVVVVFAIGIALLLTFHLRRDHNRIPLDDYNDIFLTVKGSLKSQPNKQFNLAVDNRVNGILLVRSAEGGENQSDVWLQNHATYDGGNPPVDEDQLTIGSFELNQKLQLVDFSDIKHESLSQQNLDIIQHRWFQNSDVSVHSPSGVFGIAPESPVLRGLLKANSDKDDFNKAEITLWVGKSEGLMTVGRVEKSKCSEDWRYLDQPKGSKNWALSEIKVAINGTTILTKRGFSIVDTMSKHIGFPDRLFPQQSIFKSILQGEITDCSILHQLVPSLSIQIGETTLGVPAKHYIIKDENHPTKCHVLLKGSGSGSRWILGRPFLRSVCVSFGFDSEKKVPRLGLAKNLLEE